MGYRSSLCSTWSTNFTQPRLCTKFGKRVFSFARLSEWNAVLEDLRAIADILDFREQLKTYFSVCF